MIYTVTLNPSIDYIVEVDQFKVNQLNRTKRDTKFPGGKGINVSRVLNRINVDSIALGFLGGFTGSFIQDFLKGEQIQTDFIEVSEDTRINVKLKSDSETEINGLGPSISSLQYEQILEKIKQLKNGDTIILAGNVAPNMPSDFYETVSKECENKGIDVIVDTSGPSLLNVVKHKPFLIKPNHHELGEIFETEVHTIEEAALYGKKLVALGAKHVIVSMAGDGAVLCTSDKIYTANVPKGNVVNSVGAGDSLVAGFVGTYKKTGNLLESFKFSIASGSATAFSADLCQKADIERLVSQIEVSEITGGGKG
ncbi:1-phosphofructokinase [Peribacillus loiseleuriae]|uniref:1-phosphofructokinase n=1 Tax=Peribacillus loiseleuriae TaxID=1679170 RepID=UPI003D02ED3F